MCAIFGAFDCPRAAEVTFVGLHEMQSRAKQFAGIVTFDGEELYRETGPGIVQDVFTEETLGRLYGRVAIGHIRYSTIEDDPEKDNTQPLVEAEKRVAICHNGNITNTEELRSPLCQSDLHCPGCKVECPFKTSLDTEIILKQFCESKKKDPFERTFEALQGVQGTYSLLIIHEDMMIAVRDPYGNRPLWLGSNDGSWFVSSETVSFQNLGIKIEREVAPGEILVISASGLKSRYFDETKLEDEPVPHRLAKCIFELLYYSHPASLIFGQSVAEFRLRTGKMLHDYFPVPPGLVVEVPDSAKFHALGYARGDPALELIPGITRSHYIGRTFVERLQAIRIGKVHLKFTPIHHLLSGQNIILIDDSIVRLNTLPRVVELLRMIGVKEIHGRIATPRIKYPCHYGIDTPTRRELIASDHTKEEIRLKSGLDSLEFLRVEHLKELVEYPEEWCFTCMTGEYPIPILDYAPAVA